MLDPFGAGALTHIDKHFGKNQLQRVTPEHLSCGSESANIQAHHKL